MQWAIKLNLYLKPTHSTTKRFSVYLLELGPRTAVGASNLWIEEVDWALVLKVLHPHSENDTKIRTTHSRLSSKSQISWIYTLIAFFIHPGGPGGTFRTVFNRTVF